MAKRTLKHRLKYLLTKLRRKKLNKKRRAKNESNAKGKKKTLSLRRKLLLSFNVIAVLVLAYFVILTSIGPKSFPFVTEKIQSTLRSNLGAGASIKNSFISFTSSGRIKISVIGVKVPYATSESLEQKIFTIPQVDAEFSLLKMALLNFYPSKIKVIGAVFVLDDLRNLPQNDDAESGHEAMIIQVLSAIKIGKLPIKSFDLEDTLLVVKDRGIETKILVKKSLVKTSVGRGQMRVVSDNRISFNNDKNDVTLHCDCNFSDYDGLKCKMKLDHFEASSIATLNPSLNPLSQIKAVLSADASFEIEKNQFKNIDFVVSAAEGEFELPEFFSQKMRVKNFLLEGQYDHRLRILNLSKIRTEFDQNPQEIRVADVGNAKSKNSQIGQKVSDQKNPSLEMSLLISDVRDTKFVVGVDNGNRLEGRSDVGNKAGKKLDLYISLQDVPTKDLEKFWPVNFNQNDIRSWVTTSITGGDIKSAYAKFSMTSNDGNYNLTTLDSQIAFSGWNLNYDDAFPTLSDISGVARFNERAMKIAISEGKVLDSEIYESEVAIDDFEARDVILKIVGKARGKSVDGLRHVDNSAEFATKISKYLNGNAISEFEIHVPLLSEAFLESSYVKVKSAVIDLNNPYVKGAINISLEKKSGVKNFVSEIGLTDARLEVANLDLRKEPGIEAGLNFNLVFNDEKHLDVRKILLWKKEEIQEIAKNKKPNKAAKIKDSSSEEKKSLVAKVSGDLSLELNPLLLVKANFVNKNFGNGGKNDYKFSYFFDKKKALQSLSVVGQRIGLEGALKQKNHGIKSDGGSSSRLGVLIKISRADLLRNKFIKNFSLTLNCVNGFCYNVSSKANYGTGQFFTLNTEKKPKENFTMLNGHFSDVGYLVEGLGVSNVVGGGYVRAMLKQSVRDNKTLLAGEVYVKDQVTIYDNPAVKKLASNSLFSKVRDKIFSSDKVVLTTAKADIELYDSTLNLKSFVANNYKIGFTAKGTINLRDDSCSISGKIVPGFIINNLFGIGKIPLLGNIVSGILTGGEENGGVFGISYSYVKGKNDKDATFDTSAVSSFVPTTIGNLFE